MRILVVDDDSLVRWYTERSLKKWGYEVITASNIHDAIKHLNGGKFDVLLTDLRMPDGNGAELLEKISEIATNKPKVIVCSSFIAADMTTDIKKKDFIILKKPFNLWELRNAVVWCEG